MKRNFYFQIKEKKTKTLSLDWLSPSGQPDPKIPSKVTKIHHYFYIDIPLKAKYYFVRQKLSLFASAGISPNIFIALKNTAILEFSDGHSSTQTSSNNYGFAKVNLMVLAGFGVKYDLTKKIFIKAEPMYRHSVFSIVETPIKSYLHSVGLDFGFYLKLGKQP